MSSVKKTNSALLSAAAAALLSVAPLTASAQDEAQEVDGSIEGKCWGVNSCKGLSSCKGATNACKGQNSCKGSGYLILPLSSCEEIGGDFAEGDDFVPVPE